MTTQGLKQFSEQCLRKLEGFKSHCIQRQSHEASFISKLELISFQKDHVTINVLESKRPHLQEEATSKLTSPENKIVLRFSSVPGSYLNSGGTVHGGALATFFDVTTSIAVWCFDVGRTDGKVTVSVSLDVDYIGPAFEGCDLYFEATVNKIGKTLAFATCRITTENGSLVATASHTLAFVDKNRRGVSSVLPRSKL